MQNNFLELRRWTMEGKYVATIDFTSLQALKTFIRIVKEAGGSVSISGERPDNSSMLDNPILVPNIESENIFSSDINIYASSTIDLERAKAVLNCEIGDKVEKSAARTLLESVTNFTGRAIRAK
jgi:SulP family sulfate permease